MLLPTKLFQPQIPADYLPRQRLLAALNDGHRQELTVVAAPAGYGKTTLVAAWLQAAGAAQRTGWLSLDEHDNDPVRFWQYVLTTLQQANPAVGQMALPALTAVPPPPLHTIVHTLINDVWQAYRRDPVQLILVLDDYHVIGESAIHDALNELCDYLPVQALRVIITTRSDPPLKQARRRVRQQLCEIRAADLRFTPAESAALYEKMQISVDAEQLARINTRTEGWAAALRLTSLSTAQMRDRLPEPAGRLLADYLLEEVVHRQPPAIQTFLLKTAVLSQFSADLAAHLLELDDAAAIIGHIQTQNLFLVPLDAAAHWFRYHHLFADLLRAQAQKQFGTAVLRRLQRRAADWYAGQQMWTQAIDTAFAAADPQLAATHLLAYLEADPSWLFVHMEWLQALPAAIMDANPLFYLVQAQLHFSDATGRRETAMQTALGRARAALDALSTPPPALEAHYAYLAAMQALLAGTADSAALLARCHAAFAAAPETAVHARGRLAYWIGLLHRQLDETEQQHHWLAQAQPLLLAANDAHIYVMAHVQQWESQIESGKSTQKTLDAIYAFKQSAPAWLQTHPITGAVSLMEGTIHFYRGNLEAATAAYEYGLERIQLTTEYNMELTALWNLAFVRFGMGDVAGALALTETLAERIPIHAPQTHILRLWFTLPQYGRDRTITAELDRWLAQHRSQPPQWVAEGWTTQDFFLLMRLFIYVRLLLRRQETDALPAAVALLAQQAEQMVEPTYWRRLLQVRVHQTLLLAAQGRLEAALEMVGDALEMAHADLHRYTFIEAADLITPLLARRIRRGDDSAWTADVLDYCRRYSRKTADNAAAGHAAPDAQPLPEPLSERELEVLALLAEGLTNKQIGERLHISPHTVRVHTSNIYGKLAVNGRAQAVAQAKSLQLIP